MNPTSCKRIYKLLMLFSIVVLLIFCSACSVYASGKNISVSVSIPPLKYVLNKIGGEQVQVSVMVPPGSNPATYEPKPRQMSALADTDMYFAIGVPFEKSWLPRFSKVNKHMRIVRLDLVINKRTLATDYENTSRKHLKPSDGNKDPHVWLSPLAMRLISAKVARIFSRSDPDNACKYRQNYLQLAREINQLDKRILKLFSATEPDKIQFMTLHPAWGYLARDYGLQQIPIKLQGKSPGPKEMGKLIDMAKALDIDTIFVQPQFSQKEAETIAEQIGAKVISLNPLAADWNNNLLDMAQKIHSGLSE